MLGQFTREVEPHCSLDFTAGDGVLLVVVGQAGGLSGNTLKDVIHEGVHDAHSLTGDAGIRVHLFHHFVDVDRVALLARLPPLLGFSSGLPGLGHSLLSFLGSYFGRHGWYALDVSDSG